MPNTKKQDRDFNSQLQAFVGKYGPENQKMVKDLNTLLKTRNRQIAERVVQEVVETAAISDPLRTELMDIAKRVKS